MYSWELYSLIKNSFNLEIFSKLFFLFLKIDISSFGFITLEYFKFPGQDNNSLLILNFKNFSFSYSDLHKINLQLFNANL